MSSWLVVGGRAADGSVSSLNLPNALTLLRIVLVPVVAVFLLVDGGTDVGWRLAAFGAFLLAIATDKVDGDLARRHDLVTDFGKVADPIADKALIGTVLVLLSVLGELPWWVTVVVLVRELGITLMRFVVIRHGIIPASRGGKLKTVLQSVALGLYLLPTPDAVAGWKPALALAVMMAAVAVTVLTGLDYVLAAARLRRESALTASRRAVVAAASASPDLAADVLETRHVGSPHAASRDAGPRDVEQRR